MAEYKGNSHRSKEQNEVVEKKVEQIAKGKTKKKSEVKKFADTFIAEDITNVDKKKGITIGKTILVKKIIEKIRSLFKKKDEILQ